MGRTHNGFDTAFDTAFDVGFGEIGKDARTVPAEPLNSPRRKGWFDTQPSLTWL